MASEFIYRVVVENGTAGRKTTHNVIYCGPSLRDARVAYLREEPQDGDWDRGDVYRRTRIERFAAEPESIESTDCDVIE